MYKGIPIRLWADFSIEIYAREGGMIFSKWWKKKEPYN